MELTGVSKHSGAWRKKGRKQLFRSRLQPAERSGQCGPAVSGKEPLKTFKWPRGGGVGGAGKRTWNQSPPPREVKRPLTPAFTMKG